VDSTDARQPDKVVILSEMIFFTVTRYYAKESGVGPRGESRGHSDGS
jgi:hypothetical protein